MDFPNRVPTVELEVPRSGKVIEVNPLTDPRWEALVVAHPDGLIYHHPTWLQALAFEQDQEPLSLAYESEEHDLLGILPLFHTRGLPFRRDTARIGERLSSLPRTPVAGPLATDDAVTRALLEAAVARADALNGCRLEIKSGSPGLARLSENLTPVAWRKGYVLALPEDPDRVRFGDSRNHSRVRWAVNYATRAGVNLRPAESFGDVRAWYSLYLETMRWHCLPPRSLQFFRALWDLMRNRDYMRLVLAERYEGGRRHLLAGSIFLRFGRTVFYAFNGRHLQDLALHPNDMIQWHAIHDAALDKFQIYDFGEVPTGNDGLHRFKRKWGATTSQLYRYYYPAPRETVDGSDANDRFVRRLANRYWKAVPLALTAVVGDLVYQYL